MEGLLITSKGYINDFYKQFEELTKKLDKANDTFLICH